MSNIVEVNNRSTKKINPALYCLHCDKCKPIFRKGFFYLFELGIIIFEVPCLFVSYLNIFI